MRAGGRVGLAVLALAAAAALPGLARAQGLSVAVEPAYSHIETDTTDQTGATTHERSELLTQSYRLSFDRALTDRLTSSAGATLVDQRAWNSTNDVSSRQGSRATTLFGRLTLGLPTLTVGAGVDRREQRALATSSSSFVTESYTGFGTWRPTDLPELELRLGHLNQHDAARRAQDTSTDSAVLTSRYGGPSWDLRYVFSWSRSEDHLNGSESTAIDQTVLGTRNDSFFANRTITYLSATFTSHNVATATVGAGNIARQQLPVTGLSAVEVFPATAVNVALASNPLLIDGSTTASATVDVGFGPSTLGDRNARDVGARFGDAITAVNTIYVWFDRPVTAVGTALSSSAAVYQSDDNQTWTAVPLAQAPLVSPFENRIELTTAQVQARYLKVALQPLAPGVTTDSAFRDVFVTEVQFLLVLPAALVPRNQSTLAGGATGSVRTLLVRTIDLAHDLQGSVNRRSEAGSTTYTLVNGLSAGYPITRTIAVSARGARQDLDGGRGHEGVWQWTAALTGKPYPTAYWTLNYSGASNDRDKSLGHSVTALGRADWYEGISTQATGSASYVTQGEQIVGGIVIQPERKASSGQATATASFTPNSLVALTLGVLYSRTVSFTAETGDVVTNFARADASLSFTPAPALSASATVSRVLVAETPTTLATVQLNYFPLRGDLQLSFAYSKTLDTAAEATTETYGPTLRWNIRRGISLTSAYTFINTDAPVQLIESRAFTTNLLITF